MGAPTTWSAPASGGTVAELAITDVWVTHAGAYWFAVTSSASGVRVRYATNPRGAWSEITMPSLPAGTSEITYPGVVHDGTTYAFMTRATSKNRVVYATDPTGTWTAYEYDATDLYQAYAFTCADGKFIAAGRWDSGANRPAFIAYCSTANGTYTFNTSAATTGYDITDGGGKSYRIFGIDFDGTTWVTVSSITGSANYVARYSTSLTSGWAAPTSFPSVGTTLTLSYGNGWWTTETGTTDVLYTDTPGGTWVALGDAATAMESPNDITLGGGHSVIVGMSVVSGSRDPRISWLASISPSGTYALATGGFADPGVNVNLRSVAYHGGYFVAGSDYYGEVRWASTTPTYLRQRQSPVRAPSRVRGVDIRNRQTPIITK